jgi:glycerophosphoryl diester phosphodiesterase
MLTNVRRSGLTPTQDPAMNAFLTDRFLCIGHRGASGLAPENTLRAFELAIALGADAIELDVHLAEGALVVIHDDDLARTTSGRGSVARASLEQLRALDAGDGERIPLLDEVLDLCAGRIAVNIELKGRGTAGPVVDRLRERGTPPEQVLLSAFDHEELAVARAAAPEYARGALFGRLGGDAIALGRRVEAVSLHLALRTLTPARAEMIRAADLALFVYTVNDPGAALALGAQGVSGVFTDYPDRLLAALGRTGTAGAGP